MDQERTAPVCDFLHVHEDAVEEVLRLLPPEERLYDLAEVFRVFGDTTRLRILFLLDQGAANVNAISSALGISQSVASQGSSSMLSV